MYRILRSKADGLEGPALEFARELVAEPSPSLGESRVADLVERRMRSLGFDRVLRDDAGNVLGILLGRKSGPTLLLASHMDTAPADEAAWSRPAHSAEVSDGRLHGLGAADCKGGLAAQVMAGELLRRSLLPLEGNVVVAATVAQENGSGAGMRALVGRTLPELGLRPSWAVLGEPTGLGLYYGHDGWVELHVRVEGADPFQVGDSARAVEGYFAEGSGREPAAVAAGCAGSPGLSRRATVAVARRVGAAEGLAAVVDRVRRSAELVARSVGAVSVEVAVPEEAQRLYTGMTTVDRRMVEAWSIDPFDPLMERSRQALAAAGCAVRASTWKLQRPGMGTAGGLLVGEFGVPALGYGPGEEELAHAPDESVPVQAIGEAVYGTAAVAHALVGVPVFGWTSDEI